MDREVDPQTRLFSVLSAPVSGQKFRPHQKTFAREYILPWTGKICSDPVFYRYFPNLKSVIQINKGGV